MTHHPTSHATAPVVARLAFLVLAPLVAACGARPVHVERAAIALDVAGAPAALYLSLLAEDAIADSIEEIWTDAGVATLQTARPHRMTDGPADLASLMAPVAGVPIDAQGAARLAPGGYTALLSTLRRPLAEGDSVTVQVRLARGRRAEVRVPVLPYEALEAALLTPAERAEVAGDGDPDAAEGGRLFRANGCASCHGAEGHGDGPVGRTLRPPPRDFRAVSAFKGGTDAARIARTLAAGMPGGGAMPLYAHLTNHERAAIARYLISLRTPDSLQRTTP